MSAQASSFDTKQRANNELYECNCECEVNNTFLSWHQSSQLSLFFYFASEPPQKRMVCSKMAPFNEKWKTGSQGFAFTGSESIFKPLNFQLPLGFILSYAFLS